MSKELVSKELAMLRQRIVDIAYGAGIDDVETDQIWCINAKSLGRLLVGINAAFIEQMDEWSTQQQTNWCAPQNLHYFNGLESATELLWDLNLRA